MKIQNPNNEKSLEIASLLEKIKERAEANKALSEKRAAINVRQFKINNLKNRLQATDYQAIKYAEGELSAEEYAETREQRRAWRAEINALEAEIVELEDA